MSRKVFPLVGTVTNSPLVVGQIVQAAIETGDETVLNDPTTWRSLAAVEAQEHQDIEGILKAGQQLATPTHQQPVTAPANRHQGDRQSIRTQPIHVLHRGG